MKNVLISIATAVLIAIFGFIYVSWGPYFSYSDTAIIYLATVIGGGCCWIGLNLRKK